MIIFLTYVRKAFKIMAKKKQKKQKSGTGYVLLITLLTFLLAITMQFLSDMILEKLYIIYGFFILLAVIFIGIIFDILGVATTSVSEISFHAMASDKVKGAKESIVLIKNAEKVSNICNDVIGDVCGIISGSITTFIVASLNLNDFGVYSILISLCIMGLVSALTVGGKAFGKFIAIANNKRIVFFAGKVISFFKFGR